MAKIDGSRYPERLTAEDAVEVAEVTVNEFNGQPPSKEVFAQELGHSTSNSGAYIKKIADARSYGLLPTQGLEATDLAHRVANPKDEKEYHDCLFEMYENVPILRKLYEHLDGHEPPNQLWNVLIEVTDASRNEAKESEDSIKGLYEHMIRADTQRQRLSSKEQQSQERVEPESESGPAKTSSNAVPDSEIYLKVGSDEHKFEELSTINIEIAQKILESKKPSNSIEDDSSKGVSQDDEIETDTSIEDFG